MESTFSDPIVMCKIINVVKILTSSQFVLCSNKAVADGALSFYLDHRVSARVAKKTYGVEISKIFLPSDPQHKQRAAKSYTDAAGNIRIGGVFSIILPKVCYSNQNRYTSQDI